MTLRIERSGPTQVWTINLPEVGNAITDTGLIAAVEAAVDAANSDTTVRAAILTGEGRSSPPEAMSRRWRTATACSASIRSNNAMRMSLGYSESRGRSRVSRCRSSRRSTACDRGGLRLAMMCDIRVASERASFAESFVQIGLVPGDGGTWFLQRAIGYERAAEMTLTGDRIDAETALAWGMVSRVVPHDELLSTATDLAERITKESAACPANGQTASPGIAHRDTGVDFGHGRSDATARAP